MKKGLLFTLAVLCVSAAQAVTVSWSTNDKSCDTWGGNYDWSSIDFTLAAASTMVVSDMPASGKVALQEILIAKRGSGDTTITSVRLTQGDTVVIEASVSSTDNNFVTTMENGGVYTRPAWQIVFDNTEIDVTKTYTLVAYNGDTQVYISSSVVKDDGQGWMPSMKVTAETITVPEPTALALLALGAAGLALKRKVA